MRPKQHILSLAGSVADGETVQTPCPFCKEDYENQGRPVTWSPRRSMSVTREGYALLYNCFRASCARGRGVVHVLDGLSKAGLEYKKGKTFEPKSYVYKTVPAAVWNMPKEITLTEQELIDQHVRYAVDRDTVVYPIFDVVGHEVGVVDRSYKGRSPKALSYWFKDVPKVHFPLTSLRTEACVVVEDIPSSIKLVPYINSVALLGTNITSDCLTHLSHLYEVLIIILDEDATAKALEMEKQYRLFFKAVVVVPAQKDIKNMTDKEIKALLRGLI